MNPTMAAIRDKDDAHPLGVVGWRSEYHAMRAALDAVLAAHKPTDALMNPGRHERVVEVCTGCGQDDGNWQHWPCPTVRTIAAHLDIEPR